MASLIKATVWFTCFTVLLVAVAAEMYMPPGMAMPPGMVMPPPSTSNLVSPSLAIGFIAFIVSILVVNQRA
ncbi:hypothetical protein V6N12_020965 [Hibiscus sabdariffa]|uniref:Transmembrane protein n=1 Tax=Hibiscus sabdariffa TaxID=183260 RepID=A0ABR2CZM0_9ROSI